MDVKSPETPAQPVLRFQGDEDADLAAVVNNFTSRTYREWPNDAGVCTRRPSTSTLLTLTV